MRLLDHEQSKPRWGSPRKRQGQDAELVLGEAPAPEIEPPVKRRRGRPLGSKDSYARGPRKKVEVRPILPGQVFCSVSQSIIALDTDKSTFYDRYLAQLDSLLDDRRRKITVESLNRLLDKMKAEAAANSDARRHTPQPQNRGVRRAAHQRADT